MYDMSGLTGQGGQAPIVVGIDGSSSARDALGWAVVEATILHRPLHILHSVGPADKDYSPGPAAEQRTPRWARQYPPGPSAEQPVPRWARQYPPWPTDIQTPHGTIQMGERVLADAETLARAAVPDMKVTSELVTAAPAKALLDLSQNAELVVVGSRGRDGFPGMLLGSVGAAVAAHARCPVVVVQPGWDDNPRLTRRHRLARLGRADVGPLVVGDGSRRSG